jgi:hypothetical protein
MVESRFFASVTVLDVAGLEAGVDLLAVVLVAPVALDVVLLEVVGLAAGLGLDELIDSAGLRVVVADEGAPRFSARLSVFNGELWTGARDVLLGALDNGFFFSSPEPPIEACDRWLALADVGAVALVGFRTVEVGTAPRTGGLLNPLVARVADDDAVDLVAPGAMEGRFAAPIPTRFGGTFSFFAAPFAASFGGVFFSFSFSVSVSTSDAIPVVSSVVRTSVEPSSWGGGTSGVSTSAIMRSVFVNF